MRGRWVAIQWNRSSGVGRGRRQLYHLVCRLREHGIRPHLYRRRRDLKADLKNDELRQNLICIVAAGGDGTVGDLINRYRDIPLAILPLGTENLLARYLGIPRDGKQVADIIAQGNQRTFDVGLLNERRFLLLVSAGFDADVIRRTEEQRNGGPITHMSYLRPIWQALWKYSYPDLKIYCDDEEEPVDARLAMIVNLPAYALNIPICNSASGTDGKLEMRLFQHGSGYAMWRYFLMVCTGRHEKLPDVKSLQAKRIRIESDQPVPLQIDGDAAGWTPAEITIDSCPAVLFAPMSSNGDGRSEQAMSRMDAT